jgi:two-component system, chemotaxis family, CheB/CheR fusion protein
MAEKNVVDKEFERLLEQLKQTRGFDFTGYKRTTLMRRVEKRMGEVGIEEFGKYGDYLEAHPDEFRMLFNTILINVTSFFRDRDAWDALVEQVIHPLAEEPERALRVWSAGCASGEETYTLAIVLAEALGDERFKKCVKIYATDADSEALGTARTARYTTKDLEAIPEHLRKKYFEPNTHGWVFRADLRRCIIFGEHDLVQDAPISRIDLLVCRNTLIYFNSETQTRILARFHFALAPHGHVFLGKSEMLLTHSRLFSVVDGRARIFKKIGRGDARERLLILAEGAVEDAASPPSPVDLRQSSFDAGPVAQLVVDRQGLVALINQQARNIFRLNQRDIGRPVQDLEVSYRPVEIRSRIEQAYASRAPVEIPEVEYSTGPGNTRYFEVRITPLIDSSVLIGASICYVDITQHHRFRAELERSSHDLEAAYEELQATNEELETTNEELQSTVEELETTNEELQSTNEELETMNEELHSTNEELATINEELRRRTIELNTVNELMEAIMASMRSGVVVTDQELHVAFWNSKAEDLWGLRQDEVEGKVFTNLDIGLPVDGLAKAIRKCLEGKSDSEEVFLGATNRRGKPIRCRVGCTRLVTAEKKPRGLIITMEEWKDANAQL